MYSTNNNSLTKFFGISEDDTNSGWDTLGKDSYHIQDDDTGIILLWQERTLYDYPLATIYDLYSKIGSEVLMLLCTSVTSARGSGERKWINTQWNTSNFNANICLKVSREISEQVWNLQERISVAIADTLLLYHPDIHINYPFHYTINGGKVAWHLIQKIRLDSEYDFLRIGIGTNTAPIAPRLPNNDQLAQDLFRSSYSLDIPSVQWIDLAKKYKENIKTSLQGDSRHHDFLEYLNLKEWDPIEVYEDNGTIQFGSMIVRWVFWSLNTDGSIVIGKIPLERREYHIKKY